MVITGKAPPELCVLYATFSKTARPVWFSASVSLQECFRAKTIKPLSQSFLTVARNGQIGLNSEATVRYEQTVDSLSLHFALTFPKTVPRAFFFVRVCSS